MQLSKIRIIRKSQGISIKELSKQTGIERNRISKIERGLVNPSLDALEKILNAIGCKLEIVI